MFERKQSSVTHDLAGARYTLTIHAKHQWRWSIVLLVLVLSGLVYTFRPTAAPSVTNGLDALKQENQRLSQELKLQSMNLQHEQATREALEQQLATQSEELKKVRKDLSFYRENTAR